MTQLGTTISTNTEVALEGTDKFLVDPNNQAKAERICVAMEGDLKNLVESFKMGNREESELYRSIVQKKLGALKELLDSKSIEKIFKMMDSRVKVNDDEMNEEIAILTKEFVSQFKDYVQHSKIVPYIKLVCSLEDTYSKLVGSEGMFKIMLENTDKTGQSLASHFISISDKICPVIMSADNDFDDAVLSQGSNIVSLFGLVNDPISLIEGE
jgi:hypothetical protein